MNSITDFRLSLCKLFQKYPLCDYRISNDKMHKTLNILLIGYGSRMETILHETMMQGQLLDTTLNITLVNTNAKGSFDSLIKKAPYLPHFVELSINDEIVSSPKPKDKLCSLGFEDFKLDPELMSNILKKYSDHSYIIVSTGYDDKNYILADALSKIKTIQKTLLVYIQNKEKKESNIHSPFSDVYKLTSEKEDIYREKIENIAFNLHYIYAKSQNERANYHDIKEEFLEPYNYLSNIEAALHIHSKLVCCGILDTDSSIAAKNFSKLITENPKIIEKLITIEHNRWIISKILNGYRQIDDINKIYQNGATTHNSVDKWHCCLVSCDPSGKSYLTDNDWENSSKSIRKDLDDLDKMSLKIHEQCHLLSNATAIQVDTLLKTIQESLSDSQDYSEKARLLIKNLERSVIQMRQHKQSAISLYKNSLSALKKQIDIEGGLLSSLIKNQLDNLETAILPLIEFVSKKDYKMQDRILVSQIPYALTHKSQSVILKTISEKDTENLFSFWQLEPRKIVFIGTAENMSELLQIKRHIKIIDQFINKNSNNTEKEYYICIPSELKNRTEVESGKDVYKLIPIPEWNIHSFVNSLKENLQFNMNYIDTTGGDLILSRSLEYCVSQSDIGFFYTKNGKMHNLFNAEELEYFSPIKSITVREMFELSGAVLQKSESLKSSDLSQCYQDLWDVQNKYQNDWSYFCSALSTAYNKSPKKIGYFNFGSSYTDELSTNRKITNISSVALSNIMPILRNLEQLNYIQYLSLEKGFGDNYSIAFNVNSKFASPRALENYLKKCFINYKPGYEFSFRKNNKQLFCTELEVSNMPIKENGKNGYIRNYSNIIKEFVSLGLIKDYLSRDDNTCSFTFTSKDILSSLQMSGTILEYVIYYSALYESNFTDVDMGFEFFHSESDNAAKNEIDVICTKDSSSLFISAKLRGRKELEGIFNYVLYEISLLAKQFGINAKPVLAAPAFSQFQINENGERVYSSTVVNALKRGVYLLGKECFKPGVLGIVLDNIMNEKENWCDFI